MSEEDQQSATNGEEETEEKFDEEPSQSPLRKLGSIIALIVTASIAIYGIKSCHKAFNEGDGQQITPPPKKIIAGKKTGKKAVRKAGKKASRIDYKNPVVRKLPKTAIPQVALLDKKPSRDELKTLAPLPKLRKYDGEEWKQEDSDIFMAVNDNKLYALFIFHDSKPNEIITKNTEKGGGSIFHDDSIEFFLMPGKNPKVYNHYLCSASGKSRISYYSFNSDHPTQKSPAQRPSDAQTPIIKAERFDKGYLVYMEIDLREIGLKKIAQGDSFSIQVVRNYRGQRNKESQILHMFPTFIYADKRYGASNHDRRGFQPVKIIKENAK